MADAETLSCACSAEPEITPTGLPGLKPAALSSGTKELAFHLDLDDGHVRRRILHQNSAHVVNLSVGRFGHGVTAFIDDGKTGGELAIGADEKAGAVAQQCPGPSKTESSTTEGAMREELFLKSGGGEFCAVTGAAVAVAGGEEAGGGMSRLGLVATSGVGVAFGTGFRAAVFCELQRAIPTTTASTARKKISRDLFIRFRKREQPTPKA